MMANIDSQFETDEGYENYDDLYDEKVKYLKTRGVQGRYLLYSTRSCKDKIYSSASETLFECIRGKSSL